jgi:hypothetical protein
VVWGPSAVVSASVGAKRAGFGAAGDGLRALLQCGHWNAVATLAVVAEWAGMADFGNWSGLCQQKGDGEHGIVGE